MGMAWSFTSRFCLVGDSVAYWLASWLATQLVTIRRLAPELPTANVG